MPKANLLPDRVSGIEVEDLLRASQKTDVGRLFQAWYNAVVSQTDASHDLEQVNGDRVMSLVNSYKIKAQALNAQKQSEEISFTDAQNAVDLVLKLVVSRYYQPSTFTDSALRDLLRLTKRKLDTQDASKNV